jgi:putative acetyltransferase
MLQFQRTDSDNPDFQSLVQLLDADLAIRDGDDHAFYAQFNKTASIRQVIVVYDAATPVACGAFKPYAAGVAELKRMYVLPVFRRRSIAAQILLALEAWALEIGYRALVLETGMNQPEAIALYHKAGYHQIPNYGQYAGIDNSVCFEKILANG